MGKERFLEEIYLNLHDYGKIALLAEESDKIYLYCMMNDKTNNLDDKSEKKITKKRLTITDLLKTSSKDRVKKWVLQLQELRIITLFYSELLVTASRS